MRYKKNKLAEQSVKILLQHFGEDINREGLKDTPKRFIKFLKSF